MIAKSRWLIALLLAASAARILASQGIPSIHPEDPHRLQRDGQTWYPVGYYPALGALTTDQNDYATYYKTLLDTLARHEINYLRNAFTMGQQYGNAIVPYQRTGPGTAADGRPKYDLSQFNQAHFDYWFDVVSYANKKNIVVQIPLLDFWHNSRWVIEKTGDPTREWGLKYDFYQGRNNINGVDVNTHGEWLDPADPVFEYQKALIAKAIETLGGLPNIVWEVANEPKSLPDGRTDAWLAQLADFITRYEKSLGLKPHLVVPRDIPRHEDTPGHWLDPPARVHAELVERFSDDQPLISDNDCCVETPPADYRRHKAWAALTAGAHVSLFHYLLYDTAIVHSPDAAEGMRYLGFLNRFLRARQIDLAGMAPADRLVSRGWALARAGEEYVIYLPSGGRTRVHDLPRTFVATWFNPRDGSLSPATCPPFTAADRADWVLHIRRPASPPDKGADPRHETVCGNGDAENDND